WRVAVGTCTDGFCWASAGEAASAIVNARAGRNMGIHSTLCFRDLQQAERIGAVGNGPGETEGIGLAGDGMHAGGCERQRTGDAESSTSRRAERHGERR